MLPSHALTPPPPRGPVCRAGSSTLKFPNSEFPRDHDKHGVRADRKNPDGSGMCLGDFQRHKSSQKAGLEPAHVLALRLYTTAAYFSINQPLRDIDRTTPHQFAATVLFLTQALKKLRAVHSDANAVQYLWRGLSGVELPEEFKENGGTEFAPMSTTLDMKVALHYAVKGRQEGLVQLIKLKCTGLGRGSDVGYLSAFPDEKEILFPVRLPALPDACQHSLVLACAP